MPVWHVSVSVLAPDRRSLRDMPALGERDGVKLLAGVGGETEWWFQAPSLIGHLRVALTPAEAAGLPPGCVIADAGESGPPRPRTR